MIMIMILCHSKLHMPEQKNMPCTAYMRCIFRQIPHILPQKVLHILGKFFAKTSMANGGKNTLTVSFSIV